LHLGAGDPGIGLRVEIFQFNLAAEDTAFGIDFFNRQNDTVAPIGAGYRAGAGQFDHIRQIKRISGLRGLQAQAKSTSQQGAGKQESFTVQLSGDHDCRFSLIKIK
jgi:hypothetical protein